MASPAFLDKSRAAHEWQLGAGFMLGQSGYVFAVEFLDEAQWTVFRTYSPRLLLTAQRAGMLGLGEGPACLDAASLSLAQLWELTAGKRAAQATAPLPAPTFAEKLLVLAKQAGILPSLLWLPVEAAPDEAFCLSEEALSAPSEIRLIQGERVHLPIEGAEDSTLTSFREGANVHLALTVGKASDSPLVRVHSSCVTGDLLGSLRCDCGGQLQAALRQMKEDGSGVLLYLHQEGRGIGITSKLRAYALQEGGVDTFEANRQLGFEEDERDFAIAIAMLKALGQKNIRLLTNNPDKVSAFSDSGITVEKRLPLLVGSTAHNEAYIEAKHVKRGHHRHS